MTFDRKISGEGVRQEEVKEEVKRRRRKKIDKD